MDIKRLLGRTGIYLKKKSPQILTGIGIAGMVTATILAVRVTPKAIRILDDKMLEDSKSENVYAEGMPVKDVIAATWTCYIPTAILTVSSAACLIGAMSISTKRNAALAAIYAVSETAAKEYRDKVVEMIGEKKEEKIRDEVARERISRVPPKESKIIVTGKGDTLCYESLTGRYFYSDVDKLRKACNKLNRDMLSEMSISLNDWYAEIGLESVGMGDVVGWNIDWGLMELNFSSQLAENDVPCLVLDYQSMPRYDFY